MPNMPIGYIAPAPGRKLALGLADVMDGQPELFAAGPFPPRLVGTLGTPTTRTAAEGLVTGGRGQAPTAATAYRLWGLNST